MKKCCRKSCPFQGTLQPPNEFYRNRARPDGLDDMCKTCRRSYDQTDESKERYHKYRTSEKGLARARRYKHTAKGKESAREYRERNEIQIKARAAIMVAVRKGDIPAPSTLFCARCDNAAAEYHHYLGYEPEHWMDVVPLCVTCHTTVHHSEETT